MPISKVYLPFQQMFAFTILARPTNTMGCLKITENTGVTQIDENHFFLGDTYGKKEVPQNFCNDYYPFGLSFNSYSRAAITAQNFKFNAGSELEKMTDWYSTPFRKYDPSLGRFHGVDALASWDMTVTPSHFAHNNPINLNDPTGLTDGTNQGPDDEDDSGSGGGNGSAAVITPWYGFDMRSWDNISSTSAFGKVNQSYKNPGPDLKEAAWAHSSAANMTAYVNRYGYGVSEKGVENFKDLLRKTQEKIKKYKDELSSSMTASLNNDVDNESMSYQEWKNMWNKFRVDWMNSGFGTAYFKLKLAKAGIWFTSDRFMNEPMGNETFGPEVEHNENINNFSIDGEDGLESLLWDYFLEPNPDTIYGFEYRYWDGPNGEKLRNDHVNPDSIFRFNPGQNNYIPFTD